MAAREAAARRAQASVEAVGAVAVLLLAALLCFQLLATGYTATVADGAAEAGALAALRGRSVEGAVERALPGWARSGFSVSRTGGTIRVRLKPPSPLGPVSEMLAVSASASAGPR